MAVVLTIVFGIAISIVLYLMTRGGNMIACPVGATVRVLPGARIPFINFILARLPNINALNRIYTYIFNNQIHCGSLFWMLLLCLGLISILVSVIIPSSIDYLGIDVLDELPINRTQLFELMEDAASIILELQNEAAYQDSPLMNERFFISRFKAGYVRSYDQMLMDLDTALENHSYVSRKNEEELMRALAKLWELPGVFGLLFYGGEAENLQH